MSEPKALGEVIGNVLQAMHAPPADALAAIRAAAQRNSELHPHRVPTRTVCAVVLQDGNSSTWVVKGMSQPFRMERIVLKLKVARAALVGSEQLKQIVVGKTPLLDDPLPLHVVANPTDEIRSRLTEEELALHDASPAPTPRWNEVAVQVDAEVGALLGVQIDGGWAEKGDSIEFHFDPTASAQIENMALFGAMAEE